jgi:hypothetical protein
MLVLSAGVLTGRYIFMYLTHSDEFTPGLMQATKNITYVNIDRGYLTVPSTTNSFITVAGRDANWMDHDGSVIGLFPGMLLLPLLVLMCRPTD